MILTRDAMAFWKRLGGLIFSRRIPWRRKRTGLALEGLDVNIRGALLDRLKHQRVDEPDDGGFVVGRIEEVLRLLELVRQAVEILGLPGSSINRSDSLAARS